MESQKNWKFDATVTTENALYYNVQVIPGTTERLKLIFLGGRGGLEGRNSPSSIFLLGGLPPNPLRIDATVSCSRIVSLYVQIFGQCKIIWKCDMVFGCYLC